MDGLCACVYPRHLGFLFAVMSVHAPFVTCACIVLHGFTSCPTSKYVGPMSILTNFCTRTYSCMAGIQAELWLACMPDNTCCVLVEKEMKLEKSTIPLTPPLITFIVFRQPQINFLHCPFIIRNRIRCILGLLQDAAFKILG
jgi:hypothetical protein